MPEQIPKSVFADNLKTKFRVQRGAASPVEVELIEVSEGKASSKQEYFSLFFRGPHDHFLSQGIYTIEHEKIETLDLFLVPIAREADGFRYEAVFNRFLT